MSPSELADAITNGQVTLKRIDSFLHGTLVNMILTIINKYPKESLLPAFTMFAAVDSDVTVEGLNSLFDELKADLNSVVKIDFSAIHNAGEWLKNHPLVLRFVARHFTHETESVPEV